LFHNFVNVWATMLAPNEPAMPRAIAARNQIKRLAKRAKDAPHLQFMVPASLFTTLADDQAMTPLFGGYTTASEQKGIVVGSVLM
ncbi:MAG: hypothetical protein OEM00_12185, partial [Burkholderiaceae bacterium]|nr:hypothetical protein [Burkholderiaceae bacterium]